MTEFLKNERVYVSSLGIEGRVVENEVDEIPLAVNYGTGDYWIKGDPPWVWITVDNKPIVKHVLAPKEEVERDRRHD